MKKIIMIVLAVALAAGSAFADSKDGPGLFSLEGRLAYANEYASAAHADLFLKVNITDDLFLKAGGEFGYALFAVRIYTEAGIGYRFFKNNMFDISVNSLFGYGDELVISGDSANKMIINSFVDCDFKVTDFFRLNAMAGFSYSLYSDIDRYLRHDPYARLGIKLKFF